MDAGGSGAFFAPFPLSTLNSPQNDYSPSLSRGGLRVVYMSERTGAPRIYEATRSDRASPFTAPVELSLGTGDATDPTISSDQLELFFASSRAGGVGLLDAWTAQRPAIDQPFGAPVHVPELSSTRDDVCLHLSGDGATMLLDYDTLTAGGGAADIWTATRSCL